MPKYFKKDTDESESYLGGAKCFYLKEIELFKIIEWLYNNFNFIINYKIFKFIIFENYFYNKI